MSDSSRDDRFGGGDYRHLIDWGPRIRREAPFLRQALARAERGRVVDLGCGTGEHARWLASEGFTALGIDPSESQIARARDYEAESGEKGPFFHRAGMADLPALCDEPLDGALCVGNVLPSLEDEVLAPSLQAVARCLRPGGVLVVQLLNYARLLRHGLRHLPVNVRPDPEGGDGELVWLLPPKIAFLSGLTIASLGPSCCSGVRSPRSSSVRRRASLTQPASRLPSEGTCTPDCDRRRCCRCARPGARTCARAARARGRRPALASRVGPTRTRRGPATCAGRS